MENINLSKVEHTKRVREEGDWKVQTDRLKFTIPISLLSEEVIRAINHWWVEEFKTAYVDWENENIVLGFETEHYISKGYLGEV